MRVFHDERGILVYMTTNHRLAIYWSDAMLSKLRKEFPFRVTQDLADEMGLPMENVRWKAYSLGLRKDPEWMRAKRREILARSSMFIKKRHVPKSNLKEYIKNETPEQRKARLEKTRRTMTRPDKRVLKSIKLKQSFSSRTPEELEAWKEKLRAARYRALANGAAERAKATINAKSESEKRLKILRCNATKERNKKLRRENIS